MLTSSGASQSKDDLEGGKVVTDEVEVSQLRGPQGKIAIWWDCAHRCSAHTPEWRDSLTGVKCCSVAEIQTRKCFPKPLLESSSAAKKNVTAVCLPGEKGKVR